MYTVSDALFLAAPSRCCGGRARTRRVRRRTFV